MAPNAQIVLVEAASNSFADLLFAVDKATAIVQASGQNGQVSMSWGGSEFSSETSNHFTSVVAMLSILRRAEILDASPSGLVFHLMRSQPAALLSTAIARAITSAKSLGVEAVAAKAHTNPFLFIKIRLAISLERSVEFLIFRSMRTRIAAYGCMIAHPAKD